MLSAKMNEDHIFKNIDWVYIGENTYAIGVVNRMETEFLNLLDFDLYVNEAEYDAFCDFLALNFQKKPVAASVNSLNTTSCSSVLENLRLNNQKCNGDGCTQCCVSPNSNSGLISRNPSPLSSNSPTVVSVSTSNSTNAVSPRSPGIGNSVLNGTTSCQPLHFPIKQSLHVNGYSSTGLNRKMTNSSSMYEEVNLKPSHSLYY
jgi:hypothetical protein